MSLTALVQNQVSAAILDCCSPPYAKQFLRTRAFEDVVLKACEDVEAFARKDPAAHGDCAAVLHCYTSFKAVLHYRVAHSLLHSSDDRHSTEGRTYAQLISARGKLLSGAEIHPSASIGRRFVLDHGYGTVIGETCRIGDDCYILGGVILGASGIASNPFGARHPIVGNRVEIGAFARVFGAVVVGDDTFIGPHCVIKEDVPAGTSVVMRTEQQVTRRRRSVDTEINRPSGLTEERNVVP